jgi:hypothetical protein
MAELEAKSMEMELHARSKTPGEVDGNEMHEMHSPSRRVELE